MKKVTVNASRVYDIIIDNGILDSSGALALEVLGRPCSAAILTDSNVAPLYLERLEASLDAAGFSVISYVIPAGEESKSAEYYIAFLSFLAQNKITRSDCIFALGGGVVGDLAGFCAATYLRGVKFIQMPTTLLAMVDSSVGGKTAIDIPEGKNLVGAFYQPSLVICDYQTLDTLPENIFTDGCAEVIKYAIINDRPLFDKLRATNIKEQLEDIIENCVRNKRDVVNADERDTGVRQLLNLGHTAAHSIEILSGFEISHGSAVAIGIAVIARAANKMGLCPDGDLSEILDILSKYNLPIKCDFDAHALAKAALSDKKRSGNTISLILPFGIGNSQIYKASVDELEGIFKMGF